MKYHLIFANFLIVLARSAESQSENSDVVCNTQECQQLLQNRLETIEAAVRTIVTTLSSQTGELFAPVKEIFAQDLAISSILSATPIRSNFTTSTTKSSAIKNASETTVQITKGDSESLQQGKILVDNLKGIVKCSLAHFVDISTIDSESNLNNNSSAIAASFSTRNESLEIVWPVLSAECLKLSSGVWIRVYQINSEITKSPVETSLSVPQKCIKKNSRTTYSIVLSTPSSNGKKDPCLFSLARNLIQCRSYAVEVIPNFQTLRGKTLRTEIVIPPKLSGDSSMKWLMDVMVNSNSLKLNWKDNSGCAPQMTSLNLKVLQDGFASNDKINDTIRIPRSCLREEDLNEVNSFTIALPTNLQTCSIEWKPLDKCRKYTLDVSSQYTATWNGLSTSVDIFTKGKEGNFTIFSDETYNPWKCPKKHFKCSYYCSVSDAHFVCNGNNDCENGRDEHYCDQSVCKDGFKCGRQCIPKDLVCNGQHDCLDGSDEYYGCIYANSCQHLTDSSGNFSSQVVPRPSNEIHSERVFDATLKTTVLISVQFNQQIWLSFEKCITLEKQHFVKIYDGPYSTSPLLLSTSGSAKPFSVRSSSNELYVEFPSYYDQSYGIKAFYTSINKTNEPFVPGCGGYINGEGIISIPNYALNNINISDCFWFIEARNHEDTILLSNSEYLSPFEIRAQRQKQTSNWSETTVSYYNYTYLNNGVTAVSPYSAPATVQTTASTSPYFQITTSRSPYFQTDPPPMLPSPDNLPSIIVYDGWNPSGLVLHNRNDSLKKTAMYSISNKMLVHLKPPIVRGNFEFSWKVSKISTPECKNDFDGASGIIKSPNYPLQVYADKIDCRWSITVKPSSKIRLLFAYFETQEEMDFLYVYDGPSVYSKVLFEQSGLVPTPFEVNSTTNQVLVRFMSDGDTSYPGFLAVYSSV